jgi:hypothetical protein
MTISSKKLVCGFQENRPEVKITNICDEFYSMENYDKRSVLEVQSDLINKIRNREIENADDIDDFVFTFENVTYYNEMTVSFWKEPVPINDLTGEI